MKERQEQDDMKSNPLVCCRCGKDITRAMKFYDRLGGRYCYDCWEEIEIKSRRKPEAHRSANKSEEPKDKRYIKALYKQGYKPSEIAEMVGRPKKEVYEVLNNKQDRYKFDKDGNVVEIATGKLFLKREK